MKAAVYEILDRKRENPFSFVDINDFMLNETGQVDADQILENEHITLYALDFENGRAVFVETPPDLDLNQAPFYFIAQFEHALRVLTVPFETLIHLAKSVTLDDRKLIFIHSTGRAGSTLASKVLANVSGIINMSEPDITTQIAIIRTQQPGQDAYWRTLLDACVHLLCKQQAQTAWVIKGRSFAIEIADWLDSLFPRAKTLFLYRDAEGYLRSTMRAFAPDLLQSIEELNALETGLRAYFSPVAPLLAQYDPNEHLVSAGLVTLLWLSVMERIVQLHESGMAFLSICYEDWQAAPHQTAVAMLEYCDCLPDDLSCVDEALSLDSQAGSPVSRRRVQQHENEVQDADLLEQQRHLQAHPFIKSAFFDPPNTLQLQPSAG